MDSDGYLLEVNRVIRENFRPNDSSGGMVAATVASFVRQTVRDEQTKFGFLKFKDVLLALQQRGLIKIGENSKGALAIWLPGCSAPAGSVIGASNPVPVSPAFRPLRSEVWHAFVSDTPAGRRFLHRATGELRVGANAPLSPLDEWVEITPLDKDAEREQSRQFIQEKNLLNDPNVSSASDSARWYVDVPDALARIDDQLARAWRRARSNRVIAWVENWCDLNNVDRRLVFQQQPLRAASDRSDVEGTDLREPLLRAIQRMSTDQLLDLAIPARHLIAAIRPRLLDT